MMPLTLKSIFLQFASGQRQSTIGIYQYSISFLSAPDQGQSWDKTQCSSKRQSAFLGCESMICCMHKPACTPSTCGSWKLKSSNVARVSSSLKETVVHSCIDCLWVFGGFPLDHNCCQDTGFSRVSSCLPIFYCCVHDAELERQHYRTRCICMMKCLICNKNIAWRLWCSLHAQNAKEYGALRSVDWFARPVCDFQARMEQWGQ